MCIYVWIIANMIRACMLMKILLIIVLNTEKIGIRYCSNIDLEQYQRLLTNVLIFGFSSRKKPSEKFSLNLISGPLKNIELGGVT